MKFSTAMLASLMIIASSAALAEGGAERSKEFYKNFKFTQNQIHDTAEQRVAAADGRTLKSDCVKEEKPDS